MMEFFDKQFLQKTENRFKLTTSYISSFNQLTKS